MSFVADGSDYTNSESDYEDSESDMDSATNGPGFNPLAMNAPTSEEKPVPLSKNAGSRFIAFVWDHLVDEENRDRMDLHEERVKFTTDHIMYCRKTNLYNETFNYNSMVDVVWSYPLLSSDLKSYIGHALCLDSNTRESAEEFLRNDPIIQSIAGKSSSDILENISILRWRHLKDYSLRQDDGREGLPTMIIGLHNPPVTSKSSQTKSKLPTKKWQTVREQTYDDHLKYLIQSDLIIQAGPLHVGTAEKDDPKSVAIGDLIIMNAHNRNHAIEFAENDPLALAGLYQTLKVHRFNDLDVTGKFVVDNIYLQMCNGKNTHMEMKEALQYWGYPVSDKQTRWLNR